MSSYPPENRVRLDPAVFALLEQASRVTGLSMKQLATEGVRKYLQEIVLVSGDRSRRSADYEAALAFWDKQIQDVENQLNDLRMHKRMMDLMRGTSETDPVARS